MKSYWMRKKEHSKLQIKEIMLETWTVINKYRDLLIGIYLLRRAELPDTRWSQKAKDNISVCSGCRLYN